jgi:spore maturation protein CgeB
MAGPWWHKVFPPELMQRYVTAGFLKGAPYRENIWRSKVNLSFITLLNEEDVAHKAFEITACGGFLLALRSPGHLACFEEDKEATFFSSLEECAEKARYYLEHPEEREAIAARGRERAVGSGYDNDTQLGKALLKLEQIEVGR